MVVREDGTKWACHSCLKGHRVSGCTHTDRELVLVPKKGRPVTQCQHCRLERKKRSAHVKCECGEVEKPHHSKEKCIHLRELEDRARAGFHDEHPLETDASHLTAVAEEQGCCCHHGGKCSCALLRKEQDDHNTLPHGPAVQKPRLEATRSDGSITVFANGHHKPVHRKNHAAHECGIPYKLPMARAHTDQKVSTVARRSVDSLILDTRARPAYIYSDRSASSVTDGELSMSEHPSPKIEPIGTCGGLSNSRLSSIDFSSLGPITTNQSVESTASDMMAFPPMDPMSAAADSSFDPWSALPSAEANRSYFPDNNPFGAWATQFDGGNVAQPALTAASSGTQSESDEIPHMDDLYGFPMPSIQEDEGSPLNMPIDSGDGANLNRRSLPPNFFGNADLGLPPSGTEWQTNINVAGGLPVDSKKAMSSVQSFEPHQWTPTMSMMSISQRPSSNNTPSAGRPQSHSVGPSSAPNEDIIKQLFPDIDVGSGFNLNGGASGPTSPAAWKKFAPLPNGNPTTGSMDYTNMDDDVAFTSQPWTDGSVSVPNDAFMPPFNLDQDYPTPDFSTWQQ